VRTCCHFVTVTIYLIRLTADSTQDFSVSSKRPGYRNNVQTQLLAFLLKVIDLKLTISAFIVLPESLISICFFFSFTSTSSQMADFIDSEAEESEVFDSIHIL
jgi:hypothetical protein